MNEIEYNKELLTEFPFLLPRNVWTGELDEDYDYSYTLLDFAPVGWKKLFLQCCRDLAIQLTKERKLNKFRFTQIKEKYNTLRMYNNGCSQECHDILLKYEYLSSFVCQKCGKPADYETEGWLTSLCKDCFEKQGLEKKHIINMDLTFTVTEYSLKGENKKVYDCTEEGGRYLKSLV